MNARWLPKDLYVIAFLVMLGLVTCGGLLSIPLDESRQSARDRECRHNLKMLGLALHHYHDKWGSFPPAFVADENGRPIHSWRTLILPYLDKAPLYQSYRFDEPWDGTHNSELPKEFRDGGIPVACPDSPDYPTTTSYLAVIGPNTAWPGLRGAKRDVDFPDGLSSTILLVEVENSGIDWLEPQDLRFDQISFRLNESADKSLSSRHRVRGNWPWSDTVASVNVLFADGTVRRIPGHTRAETIRAWLTANGGETVSPPP